jgi:PTS system ascorbate-specific IIC component
MIWFWFLVILNADSYNWATTIVLGIFAGCWAAVASNLTVEATQRLTGGANFAIGHQEMLGILVTDKLAPKFGKAEDSFENLKLPGWLSIFTDNVVSTTVLMCVFMGVVMGFIGPETMMEFDTSLTASTWYVMYIFKTCVTFSVYMVILLTGVRMVVGELTKAFRGFSDKLLKGSMPAVDCAVTYSFVSGNVPVLGFAMGLIGELIGIAGLLIFKAPILLLPAFIPLFFDNATLACFANKAGGRKAAIAIPLINGVFQVAISELMLLFFQSSVGFHLNAWGAFFDNNTLLPGFLVGSKLLNPIVIMLLLCVVMLAVTQVYYKRHQEHYWDHMNS